MRVLFSCYFYTDPRGLDTGLKNEYTKIITSVQSPHKTISRHSLLVGRQVGVGGGRNHVVHKGDTVPVGEEGVQEALVPAVKAAGGLCVLQEAVVGVLGWCKHEHA